jgi:hypothetical protein
MSCVLHDNAQLLGGSTHNYQALAFSFKTLVLINKGITFFRKHKNNFSPRYSFMFIVLCSVVFICPVMTCVQVSPSGNHT